MSVEPVVSGECIDVYLGSGDLRKDILYDLLPAGAEKWINFLTNQEVKICYTTAIKLLEDMPVT
jgi:hypothetical protein